MKKLGKTRRWNVRFAPIGRNTRPVAASSGFRCSPGPPPSGDAHGIVPAHRHGQRNGRQVWCFFVVFFLNANPVVRQGNTVRILAR